MPMGYRNGDLCFATLQEAVDAHYSGIPPLVAAGNTTTVYQYRKAGDVWLFEKLSYGTTGGETLNFSVNAPGIDSPICDFTNDPVSNFYDGMQLGWAVAASMIVVYLIRRIHR